MPKQLNQRIPPTNGEKLPYTPVDPDGFKHELTQIYLELKGYFTPERIGKKYPVPEISPRCRELKVAWSAPRLSVEEPALPLVVLANSGVDIPDADGCVSVDRAQVMTAAISAVDLSVETSQTVGSVPYFEADTCWQAPIFSKSKVAPPLPILVGVKSMGEIKVDTSGVVPPEPVVANVQWEEDRNKKELIFHTPDTVMADIAPEIEFVYSAKGDMKVPVALVGTQVRSFERDNKQSSAGVNVVSAKCTIDDVGDVSPRILRPDIVSAKITHVDEISLEGNTMLPASVVSAKIQTVDLSVDPISVPGVVCTKAGITAVPEYKSGDFAIPECGVTIYENPELPDLGLHSMGKYSPPPETVLLDALAVWEAMGGPKAFASDGIILNLTKE